MWALRVREASTTPAAVKNAWKLSSGSGFTYSCSSFAIVGLVQFHQLLGHDRLLCDLGLARQVEPGTSEGCELRVDNVGFLPALQTPDYEVIP